MELSTNNIGEPQPAARAWVRALVDPLVPLFKETLAVSFFINLLAVAVPVFVLQVYDRVIFHAGLSTLEGLVIGVLAVVAFDFLLRRARARILQSVALNIDVSVSRNVVEKLLSLPLRTLESRPGAYWHLVFRDTEIVRNTLSGATAVLAADLIFALIFLALVAIVAWPVFWVLVLVFAAFAALTWRAGHFIDAASAREKSKTISRDALVSDLILGRTTVKALALEGEMRRQWEERQHDTIREGLERGQRNDLYVYLSQSLTMLATVAMTTVGALAILDHKLTVGGLVAANMLSSRLLSPLGQLIGAWRTYIAFTQSIDRLGRLFAEADELGESPVAMPRPAGRITLNGVTFRYAPELAPAVENISLDIAPGGMTAIMGANGCGKTTLAKLIVGLYRPEKGEAYIDKADIAQFARRDLAQWVGYVPQDNVLFAGSIRHNIACGRADATDEEVVEAATLARAHALISILPKGYGTPVGEGGGQLAGGLRQRISIARALLGDPPILVMDEPTASLDRRAEEELRDSLLSIARTHTILLITHSPVMLNACHNVIVMERGRIKAAGPTQRILQAMSEPPVVAAAGGSSAA